NGDDFGFHLVGEGVAVERPRIQAGLASGFVEGAVLVPAGRRCAVAFGGALERHAEGGRAAAEGGGDAGGEPVTRRRAEDQGPFRTAGDGTAFLNVVDLLFH